MKNYLVRFSIGLALALATALIVSCYTVPETGRSSLNLLPNSQLSSMAQAQFGELKKQETISTNASYNEMVRRVGERIVISALSFDAPLPPLKEWEFVVFEDDDTINAFAMPGGKVGIYTGMLKKVATTEEMLAVVMGHEIAHVVANHGNERVSQQILASVGALGLGYALREESEATQVAVMTAYGLGSQVGILLPYSRTHESEADHIGLLYMARAGYNPQVAPKFWEKMMEASEGSAPPEFLSTHPSNETRIENLNNWMPEAMQEYEAHRGEML